MNIIDDYREVAIFLDHEPVSSMTLATLRTAAVITASFSSRIGDFSRDTGVVTSDSILIQTGRTGGDAAVIVSRITGSHIFTLDFRERASAYGGVTLRSTIEDDTRDTAVCLDSSVLYMGARDVVETASIINRVSGGKLFNLYTRDLFRGVSRADGTRYATVEADLSDSGVVAGYSDPVQNITLDVGITAVISGTTDYLVSFILDSIDSGLIDDNAVGTQLRNMGVFDRATIVSRILSRIIRVSTNTPELSDESLPGTRDHNIGAAMIGSLNNGGRC